MESLLTGAGSFALQRTRDFRVVGEPCFPLRKARDWNLMLRSAKLWQQADQKQLDDEIYSLLNDKQYVPKVVFETPRGLKEASGTTTTGTWLPEVSEQANVENISASIVASESGPAQDEHNSDRAKPGPAPDELNSVDDDRAKPGPAPAELNSLDDIESQLRQAKSDLDKANSYGGGFSVAGRALRKRKDSKRPTEIEQEVWDAYNDKQKADAEIELGSKRNKLREKISKLEADAVSLRGAIALLSIKSDESIVIKDLKGYVATLNNSRIHKFSHASVDSCAASRTVLSRVGESSCSVDSCAASRTVESRVGYSSSSKHDDNQYPASRGHGQACDLKGLKGNALKGIIGPYELPAKQGQEQAHASPSSHVTSANSSGQRVHRDPIIVKAHANTTSP